MAKIISTAELLNLTFERPQIESTIDEVVDNFFGGGQEFKILLKETAAHEAHFGELSPDNIMQLVPKQLQEFKNPKYAPQLGAMGIFPDSEGNYDIKDPKTNIILGAMTYVTKKKNMEVPKNQKDRYKIYKDLYNTEAGDATWEAYSTSLKKFDMLEPEKTPGPQSSLIDFLFPSAQAAENKMTFSTQELFGGREGIKSFSTEDLFGPQKGRPSSVKEIGKGVLRGLENIPAGVGAMLQWIGDVGEDIFTKALDIKRELFPKKRPKEEEILSIISSRRRNLAQKASRRFAEWGETASEYWRKQRESGIEAPDPGLFQGSFMQNPSWTRAGAIIAEAIPSLATATAVTFITKSPVAGAASLGLLEGAGEYQEAIKFGEPVKYATAVGISSAIGNTILEILPLTTFLRGGSKKLVKDIFIGAAQEGGEEVLQALWTNSIVKFGYDNTRKLTVGMVEGFIGGAGSGGLLGGITSGRGIEQDGLIQEAIESGVTPGEIEQMQEAVKNQIVDNADKIDKVLGESVKKADPTFKGIIEEAGGVFRGLTKGLPAEGDQPALPGIIQFDDPQTGTTLAIKEDEVSLEAIKTKIEKSRAEFKAKEKPIKEEPIVKKPEIKGEQALIEEAKKFKTVEEFVEKVTSVKEVERITKELEEAKGIHLEWAKEIHQPWRGGRKAHIGIAAQKDIVIAALRGDKSQLREAATLLSRWVERHNLWIEKVRENPSQAKKAGGIDWHNRWIKTYNNAINILKTQQIKTKSQLIDIFNKAKVKAPVEKPKEPWQMTRDEFFKSGKEVAGHPHISIVREALQEGKLVPSKVLEDYPDLVKKYGRPKPRAEGKTYEVFQGKGTPVEDIYKGVSKPVIGDAKYYAFKAQDAKQFGKVSKKTIILKNPLTIDSDTQWQALTTEAGWKYPNLFGLPEQETSDSIDAFKKMILSKGHDSVIIKLSDDKTKTMRRVFSVSQIADYTGMEDVFKPPAKLTETQKAKREEKEITEALRGEEARILATEKMFKEGKLTKEQRDRWIKESEEQIERIKKFTVEPEKALEVKSMDYVQFKTEGGFVKYGDVKIINDTIYIIPDGANNPIPLGKGKILKIEQRNGRKYIEPTKGGVGVGAARIAATGVIGKGGYGTIESSERAAERAKRGKIAKTDYSKVAEELPVNEFGLIDEALKLVAPAVRKGAQIGKRILRKNIAELAHKDVVVAEALRKAHRAFTWMNKEDTLKFIDNMETGQSQVNDKLQKVSDMMRGIFDGRRTDIQNLGKGHLESYIQNYFPHIWKDPQKAKNVIASIMGKKRLEGTKAFLKKRVIITVKDGVSRGLELVSENPVDLVLLKTHEIDRYIMAQQMIQDLKEKEQIKFVYARGQAPEGYIQVNDSAFTVYMPPEITKKDYYDQIMVDDLMSIAQHLGIDTKRFVSIGGKRIGFARWFPFRKGGEQVRTKFASPESVLAHEIGHILGFRYNLYNLLRRKNDGEWKTYTRGKNKGKQYFAPTEEAVKYRKKIDEQWRALADARFKDMQTTPGFRGYVRSAQEKEAVMLEALLHAPEEFKSLAPDLHKTFIKFLNNNPELRPILDIKPSLVLGVDDAKIKLPGFVTLGHYYATEPVGTLLNNYLSPGLRNNKNKIIASGYNLLRGAGNVLNQAQLSLSLFHALNVTSDMAASTFGLGLRRLNVKGQRVKGLTDILLTPIAPIMSIWSGQRIRKAYTQQLDTIKDPKLKQMVEAVIAAGGRGKMDVFYYNQQVKALEKTFSDIMKGSFFTKIKSTMKLPFNLFGATLESLAKPLMEWYVPTGKMGLFAKLAQHEFERAEAGQIDQEQLWERLTQSWDSVDNRMGQLIYDNLFWEKTFKDTLMLAIRSVGWNLGSWREFGGAIVDITTTQERIRRGDVWLSQKMAYTIGAITIYSVLGAVIQYALTGEPPEEAKDYLFPKTGFKNPDGSDERLSLPTYAKDWYAWSHQPLKTAIHKIHPLWGLLGDLATNEDYFSVEVRHTDDPLLTQAGQFTKHIAKNFRSISMQNYAKMQRTAPYDRLRNVIVSVTGITSAPGYITKTPAQKLMTRYIVERIPPKTKTEEQFERSMYRRTLKTRLRKGERIDIKEAIEILGIRSYNRMIKEAKKTPFADSFNRLGIKDALNVYAIANAEERKQVKNILRSKYRRARSTTKTKEVRDFYNELIR